MIELNIKDSQEKVRVNNIFCIGKNYVDHIHEFANPEIPKEPVVFLKPNTSIITNDGKVGIPELDSKKISNDLQNEVEMIIVIGKDTYQVSEENANEHIMGYAIGLDLTLKIFRLMKNPRDYHGLLQKDFILHALFQILLQKIRFKIL